MVGKAPIFTLIRFMGNAVRPQIFRISGKTLFFDKAGGICQGNACRIQRFSTYCRFGFRSWFRHAFLASFYGAAGAMLSLSMCWRYQIAKPIKTGTSA